MSESSLESLKQKLEDYNRAVNSLESIIETIKTKTNDEYFDVFRDSVIKRFEFSIETAKKLMGKYIEYIDTRINGQKMILKKAFEFDLIEDKIWFEMIDDRNITAHEHSEVLAMELLNSIYTYALKLREFNTIITREIAKL
jgi:nucleotidyltransferase substrate binding protein (TIGR01987 family)